MSLGVPLGYVHLGAECTQCTPWGPPGHRTPIHVGFQCPQIWLPTISPPLLPAGPRPRPAVEPPPRPTPAGSAHGPAPAPPPGRARWASASQYSQRAALRRTQGRAAAGPAEAAAGDPGPDL